MQGLINKPALTLSLLSCLFLVVLFPSCSNDNSAATPKNTGVDTEMLSQRWEVNRAFRNGKPTVSMAGLYFDFTHPDSLSTNLLGQNMTETYVLRQDSVKTTGASQLYFLISDLDTSQLILETNLRATPFKFQLKKAAIPEEEKIQ